VLLEVALLPIQRKISRFFARLENILALDWQIAYNRKELELSLPPLLTAIS